MPTSKKKTKGFTFMLSEEEYKRLKVLAQLDGRSMSAYIRHQINMRTEHAERTETQLHGRRRGKK
jgi:predicted DNA-binding protein